MALTTAIFELASSNVTLIATSAAQITNDNEDEYNDDDDEHGGGNKFVLVAIFTGIALALFVTCFLLICCKFFSKKPIQYGGPAGHEHRSTRDHKKRVVIERQTTTSDEYNPDGYSYYYDDSTFGDSQGPTESDTRDRERRYERKDKKDEAIEMCNLKKNSSPHNHRCPHYVDIHKQQPKVEPRREVMRDDLIDHQPKSQLNTSQCVQKDSGLAQSQGNILPEKCDLKSSPSNGSKSADISSENAPKSASVRLFIKQDARKRNQRSMSTAQVPSTSILISPSKTTTPEAPKARLKSHSLSEESHSSPKQLPSSSISLERQESVDVPDDLERKTRTTLSVIKGADSIESSGSDRSPETVRRQYRELWSLRASYAESEENKLIEEGTVEGGTISETSEGAEGANISDQINLDKKDGDSKYKSTEVVSSTNRKDYSIDMKTEEIYRQFTSTNNESESVGTVKLTSSGHPSIEETNEEEDEEMVEIFF